MHKTQEENILRWLDEGKELTRLDALNSFGCFRLASRICNLRKKGYAIESRRENGYAVYRMVNGNA
jgi:biotin operon repressor